MASAWRRALRWEVAAPFDGAAEMARQLGTSPLVAQVLANRGATSVEAARDFLNPRMNGLLGPELLPNIDAAAHRIIQAIRGDEKITLYGDYDVDGMTGLAILRACLVMLGAKVELYVPDRISEGYGVNSAAIKQIASGGAKLLITVDCGITACQELTEAAAAGMDVIVTDHHTAPAELPPAVAVVHPRLPGSAYPNASLCGAGVAFKLAWHAARTAQGRERVDEPMRELLMEGMAMAALGTIADVVPLVGENRILATFGLRALPHTRHTGLRALLEASDLAGSDLDAYHVGFVLAPRLNACGRMGHAALAVELLTTADANRSRHIAAFLNQQNQARQKVEKEITDQAMEMAARLGDDRCTIVLAGENWHAGVIGIVASRVAQRFHRPTVLISLKDGAGHGSGRSIDGYNLHDGLAACAAHLETFGGHAMAGGLRVHAAKVTALADALEAHARGVLTPQQLKPSLSIDAQGTLSQLDQNVAAHMDRLAPFGQGNPSPLIGFGACRIVAPPKRLGRSGATLSLLLGQGSDTSRNGTVRAVGFGLGQLAQDLAAIRTVDVAAQPVLNRFNGQTSLELRIDDIRPSQAPPGHE